jgi:hypothetical protein
MVSALFIAGLLAVFALGQPPGGNSDPSQSATKKPAPGPKTGSGKADPADADVKAALAHDPDVQVARAKVLLAEAEMAKARQAVVLKVLTLRASIEELRGNVDAASERLAWSSRLVKTGQAPQSAVADDRAKVEAAKAALTRAETELRLLIGSGKEVGLEGASGTTDAVIPRASLWLARQALLDPPPVAGAHSNTVAALAALYLSGANKAPVGAIPDRLRAALDKTVKLGAKGQEVTFEKALEVFKKEAGLDVTVRYGVNAGGIGNIISEGEDLPVGAWFQLYQDSGGHGILYVREYGLLFSHKQFAPPDAPTLTEFWKQKPPDKDPEAMLKFLEFKRTELSTKYGPDHPDMVALNRQIEMMQKELKDRSHRPKK